jgi:hypothetical protein
VLEAQRKAQLAQQTSDENGSEERMVSDDFEEHKSIRSENKKEITISQDKLRESLICDGKASSEQINKEIINEDAEIKQEVNFDAVNGEKKDLDDIPARKEAGEQDKGQ